MVKLTPDFEIRLTCSECNGKLKQTGRYNKMYNCRYFKCKDCGKTTSLTKIGIKRKIKIIGRG